MKQSKRHYRAALAVCAAFHVYHGAGPDLTLTQLVRAMDLKKGGYARQILKDLDRSGWLMGYRVEDQQSPSGYVLCYGITKGAYELIYEKVPFVDGRIVWEAMHDTVYTMLIGGAK